MAREAAYVQFIHNGARGRPLQGHITSPIVRVPIPPHALPGGRGIIAGPPSGVATVVLWHHDATAIWVEEDFGGIKPSAVGKVGRAHHAIAVELPRLDA